MRRYALTCAVLVSLCGVAWAQLPPPADTVPNDPAPPPPPEPTPPPATTTTTTTTTAPLTPAAPPDGNAPLGSAIGVGVHAMLAGPVGPSIVYNGGRFHIEGILAFTDVEMANEMAIAGRGWFHVHESPSASLSVGGGIGFVNSEMDNGIGGSVDSSVTVLEGGAQVRFFATRNVALSASLGLALLAGDADAVSITGQLTGGFGITYFIF
jgi:hypothetical protein